MIRGDWIGKTEKNVSKTEKTRKNVSKTEISHLDSYNFTFILAPDLVNTKFFQINF